MGTIYRILSLFLLFQLTIGELKGYSPLRLCCDVDDYFDPVTFKCQLSNKTLLPSFHHQDGSLAEGFTMENVTDMNTCESFLLESSKFLLQTDGSIIVGSKEKSKTYKVNPAKHCLLWMKISEEFPFSSLICFPEQKSTSRDTFYAITHGIILPVAMGISAFFLAATFILYCLISELRDQLGKSLMCSIACLCLSKVLAIIIKTSSTELPNWLCIFCGLAMHVCFLQSFFWINVISILVFVSLRSRGNMFFLNTMGGFLASCVYAFGVPTIILIIVIVHDFSGALDFLPIPTPGFGEINCWFSTRLAQVVYFYAPIAILVIMNAILFCLSACTLCSLSSSSLHFEQYLKLFILMGVSWIFEVLSFLLGTHSDLNVSSYIWFLLDLFNALSGVFIFIFFACKRKAMVKYYNMIRGKKSYEKTIAMTSACEQSQIDDTNQDVGC